MPNLLLPAVKTCYSELTDVRPIGSAALTRMKDKDNNDTVIGLSFSRLPSPWYTHSRRRPS